MSQPDTDIIDTGPGWPPGGQGYGPARKPIRPGGDNDANERGTRPGSPWGLVGLIAGAVLLGLLGSVSLFVVVMSVIIVIFLHELGHYLTARWAGMKVTEFFIGFGPRIWSFHRGETEYGVKAIPAGAYVRIIGMHNLEEVDPADESRTYRQKPYWRRLSVAVAGSTMHFLIAIACLFALAAFVDLPGGTFIAQGEKVERMWLVGSVTEGSGAEEAGIQAGDDIISVAGQPTPTFDRLRKAVEQRAGHIVEVVVERDGERVWMLARLGTRTAGGEAVGFLGVGQEIPVVEHSVASAAGQSLEDFGRVTAESVKALGRFFSPAGLSDFARLVAEGPADEDEAQADDQPASGGGGPSEEETNRVISIFGALRIGSQLTEAGIGGLLSFLVILNIFIGVFNLVPLLPLDGGHVAIATYERLRSRRGRRYHADVAKLLPLTYVVVALLLVVGVTSFYLDIVRPVSLE